MQNLFEGMRNYLNELKVIGDPNQDDYHIISFRDKIWIIEDSEEIPIDMQKDIMNTVFFNVPSDVFKDVASDLDYNASSIEDFVEFLEGSGKSDIVVGQVTTRGGGKTLNTIEVGEYKTPESSIALKKIVKQLGILDVSDYNGESVGRYRMEGKMPRDLYHGTSAKFLPQILKFGLVPVRYDALKDYDRKTNFGEISNEDRIFFTASFNKAIYYSTNSARKNGGEPLIIKFRVPDKSKLVPDYDVAIGQQKGETGRELDDEYEKNLSSQGRAMGDWDSRSDHWGTSTKGQTNEVGKWGYKGRIPSNFFTEFYIPEFITTGENDYVNAEDFNSFDLEQMKNYVLSLEFGEEYGNPHYDPEYDDPYGEDDEDLYENKTLLNERMLYHGTIIDNVKSIKDIGLYPSVGAWVKDTYGTSYDMDDIPEVLFAADKEGIEGAMGGVIAQIGYKLGKSYGDVTEDDVERYGALIKIEVEPDDESDEYDEDEQGWVKAKEMGDMGYYESYPPQVEKGDWFTTSPADAKQVITGRGIMKVLRRYGARDWFGGDKHKTIKTDFFRLLLKKGYERGEILKFINRFSEEELENRYYDMISDRNDVKYETQTLFESFRKYSE